MSKIITVVKTNLSRCDYRVSLIINGQQVSRDEIKGDEGQAAAFAVSLQSNNFGARIIAPNNIMAIING